jgi:hypothetical protein
VEDGPVSFRIFLTTIFLTLIWAWEAETSEDHFRLGVSFAVPGWIRMIPFEGGGAFLPKRTMGATGKNWKVELSSFLGSGPSSYCRKNKWNQERK